MIGNIKKVVNNFIGVNDLLASYSKNPANKFDMKDADIAFKAVNRSCGEDLRVYLKISKDGLVKDRSFEGDVSIVTTACNSIFGESIIDMNIKQILKLDYEYIKQITEMEFSPRRKQAAASAVLVTRNAIHQYLGDSIIDDFSDIM